MKRKQKQLYYYYNNRIIIYFIIILVTKSFAFIQKKKTKNMRAFIIYYINDLYILNDDHYITSVSNIYLLRNNIKL